MSYKRGRYSGKKKASSTLLGLLTVLCVSAVFWPRSKSVPAKVVELTRKAAEGAPVRYDWPRSDPSGKTVELDPNPTSRNYYVILDGSGSMLESACSGSAPNKMAAAQKAVARFSQSVPDDAYLGLYAFDRMGAYERVPLGTGRAHRARFREAVGEVGAGGQTPLRTAVGEGVAKLEDRARRQLGYGEYHLVVVTDGAASGGQDPRGVVMDVLGRSPLVLHTIGFCIGENHVLNQPGRTVYRSADSPESLSAGLEQVLAESESFDVTGFESLGGSGT